MMFGNPEEIMRHIMGDEEFEKAKMRVTVEQDQSDAVASSLYAGVLEYLHGYITTSVENADSPAEFGMSIIANIMSLYMYDKEVWERLVALAQETMLVDKNPATAVTTRRLSQSLRLLMRLPAKSTLNVL